MKESAIGLEAPSRRTVTSSVSDAEQGVRVCLYFVIFVVIIHLPNLVANNSVKITNKNKEEKKQTHPVAKLINQTVSWTIKGVFFSLHPHLLIYVGLMCQLFLSAK